MVTRRIYDKTLIINYKEGDRSLYRVEEDIKDDIEDRNHVVTEGDTLQSISHRYYQSSLAWFLIADKNQLDDIFNLEVGSNLVIPNIRKL